MHSSATLIAVRAIVRSEVMAAGKAGRLSELFPGFVNLAILIGATLFPELLDRLFITAAIQTGIHLKIIFYIWIESHIPFVTPDAAIRPNPNHRVTFFEGE
jgi:hypothetical protein